MVQLLFSIPWRRRPSVASRRPTRRSASSLIKTAGSIAATFEAKPPVAPVVEEKTQSEAVASAPVELPRPTKKVLPAPRESRAVRILQENEPEEQPSLVADVPRQSVQEHVVAPAAMRPQEQERIQEAPRVRPAASVVPENSAQVPPVRPTVSQPSISDKDATSGIRKPVAAVIQAPARTRSPMAAYNRTLDKLDKKIDETDLALPNGGGVFDDYSTNFTKIRYQKGVTYNDLLPMEFTTGFNSGLERATFQMTQHQLEEAKKYSSYLGREIRNNGGPQRVVRSNAISALHRMVQDFFVANAPRDCFDGVDGEQSARAVVGLQPLPELEIFEFAVASHDITTGPMEPRITETALVTPEGWGVFDDYRTNMTKIRYEKGVTYNDLLPITFTSGFNSGLERGTFYMTTRQIEESKKLSSYVSREIRNALPSSLRVVRSSSVSLLHRTMLDYFIANAPRDCFDGVSGEQEARKAVGLPPLPELDIFEHEIKKRMQEIVGE